MALNWNWNDKIGELVIEQNGKEFKIGIYQGNALAIFVDEFTDENGVESYTVYNFFCDKEHFRRCAKSFNYAEEWKSLTLWKIPTDFWPILKDLTKRNVEIHIRPKEQ